VPARREGASIVRLLRRLGEIAVRLPLVGPLAARWRDRIRRNRLPPADVVVPAGQCRVAIEPYLPSTAPAWPVPAGASVAVVIPVYRGFEETRRCLQTVLEHRGPVPVEVIVVDDRSPDPLISRWLEELADGGRITLLRNETNRGFVASVNRGMEAAGRRDVVLLNSDTEVPANWLERLVGHAYSDARIGTVTPFSNNATICSWPALPGGDLPVGFSLERIDAACHAANRGRQVDIPTAVGFCMFIRRDCLDAVGTFDEAAFGRGYGEENDFCCRAHALGWRHVLACDTFVYHVGETSFGKEAPERAAAWSVLTRRHPGYPAAVARHIEADDAAPCRLAAAAAVFKAAPQPVILLVTHALGGGTERHVAAVMAAVGPRANFLRLEPGQGGVRLTVPAFPTLPAILFADEGIAQLAELLESFGVDRVHVHHVLGLGMDIRSLIDALGVPFDFTVHDYYTVCPRINLLPPNESRYCGEPGPATCNACIAARFEPGLTNITEWRRRHAWLLEEAERVLCPSLDVRRRMARYAPHANLLVVPHEPVPGDRWSVLPPRLQPGQRLWVGILGVVARHKGRDALVAAALAVDPDGVEFVVIGSCEPPLPAAARRVVHETGPYREADLPGLLAAAGVHAIWFPANVPETYSYTLSSAIAAGLPIVAPPLGAFPERLANRPLTWTVEATTDGAASATAFAEVRRTLERQPPGPAVAERMTRADDYYASAYVQADAGGVRVRRQAVRSLRRDGAVTVLVLPDRQSNGLISPCGYIRLVQPFDLLADGAEGVRVTFVDERGVFHRDADVLVCQRHAMPSVADADRLIEHCRRHGIRLVYDLDDDLIAVPGDHPEADHLRGRAAVVLRLVLAADRVWVATPELARRLGRLRDGVEVVPNALDDRLWQPPPPPRPDAVVRIVYMGTATHDGELAFLAPVADRLRRTYGDRVRFEVVGVTSRRLPPGFHRRSPEGDAAHASYPGFVDWFGRQRWEIAVAPLVDGQFNRCKSAIKLMDYASLGLPIVASRHAEYEAAFGTEHGVVLVDNDVDHWVAALATLIDDPSARERMGRLSREHCRAEHVLSVDRDGRLAALRRATVAPGAAGAGADGARRRSMPVDESGVTREELAAAFAVGAGTAVRAADLAHEGSETRDSLVVDAAAAPESARSDVVADIGRVLRPGGVALLVLPAPGPGAAAADARAAEGWGVALDRSPAALHLEFSGVEAGPRGWLMVLRKEGCRPAAVVVEEPPAVVRLRPAGASTPRVPVSLSRLTARDAALTHEGYPPWQGVVPLPPEGLMWAAGAPNVENFLVVADAWAQIVRRHLPEGGVVLDVGCGCGRLARSLVADAALGGYVGFDCMAPSIAWCRAHLAPVFAGMRCEFHHVDARSGEYNPSGAIRPQDVRFPCDDEDVDLVVVASVFTHLLEVDAAHYLREIARVLRPSGTALVSIRAVAAPGTRYGGDEGCIDVDKGHFLGMARDAGLECHDETGDFVGETLLVLGPKPRAAVVRGDDLIVVAGIAGGGT